MPKAHEVKFTINILMILEKRYFEKLKTTKIESIKFTLLRASHSTSISQNSQYLVAAKSCTFNSNIHEIFLQ